LSSNYVNVNTFLLSTYKRIFLWCKHTPVLFVFFSNKEFEGNTDQFLVVRHLLKNPINVTRYIRIYPVAWNRRISLRADFYGCKSGTLKYAIILLYYNTENNFSWEREKINLKFREIVQTQVNFHHQFHFTSVLSSVSYDVKHLFSTFGVAKKKFTIRCKCSCC